MSTMTQPQTTSAPAATTDQPGRTVSIVGICLGALAILFNIFTGIPALICGIVGVSKGNRLGWVAIALAVVLSAVNIAVGQVAIHVHG